jgi:hypothetical protein
MYYGLIPYLMTQYHMCANLSLLIIYGYFGHNLMTICTPSMQKTNIRKFHNQIITMNKYQISITIRFKYFTLIYTTKS